MAHLWVVVGASRGFGLELWRRVLEVDTHSHVALFSRSPIADVPDSERISFTSLDLADMDSLESTFLGALTKVRGPSGTLGSSDRSLVVANTVGASYSRFSGCCSRSVDPRSQDGAIGCSADYQHQLDFPLHS